ncbi:hypothetical protein OG462_41305 [Streptomyces sp. NBC_01077]|uniref:hypothetical protein n=1 Tax=Streptomyces sp. NBC_01077 TaxID=2903746 RepID=UPI0038698C69|nr:hypothetical protein OG462_41305 [Streptomyces sp. NBC_01077]
MTEWGFALIAAGSAILGSAVTGFFAWKAGHRQAAAAEAAGNAQANALIASVQTTLDAQRRARAVDQRRQVYVQLLEACQAWQVNREPDAGVRMLSAVQLVSLEGPVDVEEAGRQYAAASEGSSRDAEQRRRIDRLRERYIEAARRALDQT